MSPSLNRLSVLKTRKLFIGGKFLRSESGRVLSTRLENSMVSPVCFAHGSKKDLRDAVTAARQSFNVWSVSSAYLRGQILYRLAEMIESRADTFVAELVQFTGASQESAKAEVATAIDRLVYTAGWTDKVSQVFGSVNPVATPFINFSTVEPVGVVVAFAPDLPSFLAAVTLVSNAVALGNSVILIASDTLPLTAVSLAEAIVCSDIPSGVVNILTGQRAELAPAAAEHRDIDCFIDATGEPAITTILRHGSAINLKRVSYYSATMDWFDHDKSASPYRLLELTETRTTWHPV